MLLLSELCLTLTLSQFSFRLTLWNKYLFFLPWSWEPLESRRSVCGAASVAGRREKSRTNTCLNRMFAESQTHGCGHRLSLPGHSQGHFEHSQRRQKGFVSVFWTRPLLLYCIDLWLVPGTRTIVLRRVSVPLTPSDGFIVLTLQYVFVSVMKKKETLCYYPRLIFSHLFFVAVEKRLFRNIPPWRSCLRN